MFRWGTAPNAKSLADIKFGSSLFSRTGRKDSKAATTLIDNWRPPHQWFGVSNAPSRSWSCALPTAPDQRFDDRNHCGLKNLAYRH